MDFTIGTYNDVLTFSGDASFTIDNGVLEVDDPELDQRTHYSPIAWLFVTERSLDEGGGPAGMAGATGR